MSTRWAREYYELPGAYFPHSAYPVEMTMNPIRSHTGGGKYARPHGRSRDYGGTISIRGTRSILKTRAFGPIKAAVEFLVAYMKRPEARGPQWKDDKYHIFPTVPPELYALRPGVQIQL